MPRDRDSTRSFGAGARRRGALAGALLLAALPALRPALAGTPAPLDLDLRLRLSAAPAPAFAAPAGRNLPPRQNDTATRPQRLRTNVLMWSPITLEMLHGLHAWWGSGFTGDFRTANEGWFGQDTYTGGADKLGHFYSAYVGARLLTLGYRRWAGNGRGWSIKAGALTMFATLSTVEVVDGFSRDFRFSPEDVVMNGGGAALGALMETFPQLDRLIAFRLQYWPSRYTTFDPVDDYSGQTYLLALKASGLPALRDTPVVRYLEFEVGYGTRDYESRDPAIHRRYLYVGIALNLSQLLDDTVFAGRRGGGTAQAFADTFLRYVQVPGTALLHRRAFSH